MALPVALLVMLVITAAGWATGLLPDWVPIAAAIVTSAAALALGHKWHLRFSWEEDGD
jgi:hypothetical protein